MNNIYTSDQVKVLFEDLFKQIRHGDKEHQEWLRVKMMEFLNKEIAGGFYKPGFPIPEEL